MINKLVASRVDWVISFGGGESHAQYAKSGDLFLFLEFADGCRVAVYVLEDIYWLGLQQQLKPSHETISSVYMVCNPFTTVYQTHLSLLSQIL